MNKHFKSTIFLLILVIASGISSIHASAAEDSNLLPLPKPMGDEISGSTDNEKFLNLLKDYSPDGYFVVTENAKLNLSMYKKIYEHYTPSYGFCNVDVPIHETCHGLNLYEIYWSPLLDIQGYYLGDGVYKQLKAKDVFTSSEIASSVPEALRTPRYTEYILNEISRSNSDGIYGLLNEWSAYYTGGRAAYDTFSVLKHYKPTQTYITTLTAYYEFKYFILTYMLYAKQNHPETYENILKDNDLRYVINTINYKYDKLFRSYLNLQQIEGKPLINGMDKLDPYISELEKPEYVQIERTLLLGTDNFDFNTQNTSYSNSQEFIFGDVTGDGAFDSADYTSFRAHLINKSSINSLWGKFAADLNNDGVLDSADFSLMRRALLGISPSPVSTIPTTSSTPLTILKDPETNTITIKLTDNGQNSISVETMVNNNTTKILDKNNVSGNCSFNAVPGSAYKIIYYNSTPSAYIAFTSLQ